MKLNARLLIKCYFFFREFTTLNGFRIFHCLCECCVTWLSRSNHSFWRFLQVQQLLWKPQLSLFSSFRTRQTFLHCRKHSLPSGVFLITSNHNCKFFSGEFSAAFASICFLICFACFKRET